MKKGRPQDQKLRLKLFIENQIISNLPTNGYVTSPVSRQPLPPWRWLDLQVSGAAFRSCFVPTGVASGVERRGRFEPAFGEKPCLWWHLMASFPRNITGLVVLQKSGELTMFADDVGLPDHVPNVQRSQQSRPQALYDATWLGLMYVYAFVFGVHLCSWFLDVSPQARCQNPKNAGRFLPPIQSSIAPRPAWDGTQNEIVLWL